MSGLREEALKKGKKPNFQSWTKKKKKSGGQGGSRVSMIPGAHKGDTGIASS